MKAWTEKTIPKDKAIFVRMKMCSAWQMIVAIHCNGVEIFDSGEKDSCVFVSYAELLAEFETPDGNPCGDQADLQIGEQQ